MPSKPESTQGESTTITGAKPSGAPKPTEYVVLVELPCEVEGYSKFRWWFPILDRTAPHRPRVFTARSGTEAIQQHTGTAKAGKAKPGRYKAVALSSWKGVFTIPEPVQISVQQPTLQTDE